MGGPRVRALGRNCTVYGRRLLLDANIHKSDLSPRCEFLWLPRYTSDIAATHADAKVLGWDDWTWWQYTDGQTKFPVPVDQHGDPWPRSVPGVGPSDVNVFNGSEAALRSVAGSTSPRLSRTGGEDDVALTEKQAAALDWLAANMNRLEGLLDGIRMARPPTTTRAPGPAVHGDCDGGWRARRGPTAIGAAWRHRSTSYCLESWPSSGLSMLQSVGCREPCPGCPMCPTPFVAPPTRRTRPLSQARPTRACSRAADRGGRRTMERCRSCPAPHAPPGSTRSRLRPAL